MNGLILMKAKGGHSWPPLLCEENNDVQCGHFCPSVGLGDVAAFENRQP